MNAAQIHLGINHLPVVGTLIGAVVLAVSLGIRNVSTSKGITLTALGILLVSGLCAVPAYLSGEEAEEVVEHKPLVTKEVLHEHEEAAEWALVFSLLVASSAAAALAVGSGLNGVRALRPYENKLILFTLVLAVLTIAVTARTAHLGGMIRHDELRGSGTV